MRLDVDFTPFVCVLALLSLACASALGEPATGTERRDAAAWLSGHVTGAHAEAPFSFVYDGVPSGKALATWTRETETRQLDAARTEHTVTWTAPGPGLRVRLTAIEYRDVPAVDWIVRFANTGRADTPILEEVQALDVTERCAPTELVAVHHALGDSNSVDSFRPLTDALALLGSVRFGAKQGRSGEEIRSPRMLMVFWRGKDDARGDRLLRQTLLAHYTPRRGGQVVYTPICGSVGETDPDGSYEGPHIRVMKPLAERGVEVFWSDMDPQQWYPGGFPNGTGNWQTDRAKYPHGLGPIGEAARNAGLGYLLWVEPERVAKNTQVAIEHPEWVSEGAKGGLFRLDDPDARRWITETLDKLVMECGLLWLRWDFNIQPLSHWRRGDAPDRQGMTEIRHIEGLYAVWDELERRHPGLLIDICASGGRRLDIETLSRGLPLWHSDLQCFGPKPDADQLQTAALYRWLPLHGCGNFGLEPSYEFRSGMTTGNIFCLGAHNPENAEGVRRSVALQKEIRPYVLGDFYALLPRSAEADRWFAYQFHRADLDAGYVAAFRRAKCADASMPLALNGIRKGARYEVTFHDTGERRTLSGSELAALKVSVPTAPGSAVVLYRQVPERPGF